MFTYESHTRHSIKINSRFNSQKKNIPQLTMLKDELKYDRNVIGERISASDKSIEEHCPK